MLRFECDYGEGAAPAVLELLQKTNFDQTPGYGEDEYCAKAAAQIKRLCDAPDADRSQGAQPFAERAVKNHAAYHNCQQNAEFPRRVTNYRFQILFSRSISRFLYSAIR